MKNPYDLEKDPNDILEKMLGFGERSIHKSYYPELQKTIFDLKLAEERYHHIFQNALTGIFQLDLHGRVLDANPAFLNMMGFESLEEIQSSMSETDKVISQNCETMKDIIEILRSERKIEKRITRMVRKDGSVFWVSINAISVIDKSGSMIYIEGFIEDVTKQVEYESALEKLTEDLERLVSEKTRELEEANQKLLLLSNTDGLTGIANRRCFDEILDHEWRRASRLGDSITLVMLDIDKFKTYNDFYGHLAGDECLRQVAAILSTHSRRSGDLCARYGGDEFSLIVPNFDIDQAVELSESIRCSLDKLAIPHEKSPFGQVTVSIGVAASIPGGKCSTPVQLLHMADEALYQAKIRGANQVVAAE